MNANITSDANGTASDSLGMFFIDVLENEELKFSHIGYELLNVKAKNGMVVYLKKSAIQLREVVVKSGLKDEFFSSLTKSITIFRNDQITESSANHFQDLVGGISNFNWAGGTSRPRYFQIRGVGENSNFFGEGPPNFSVGYVLDDIDLSGLGMLGHTFDLQQIEVLKGPQSTVYGNNAIGGLISLKSNDPENLNTYRYLASLGNDGYKSLKALVNLKVLNNLYFRLSSDYSYSNGFRENRANRALIKNNTNKKDELFTKLKIYYKINNNFNSLITIIRGSLNNGYDAWAPDNNKSYFTYSNRPGEDSQQTLAGSIKMNLKVNNIFDLTSITSYSDNDLIHSYDSDWGNGDYWSEIDSVWSGYDYFDIFEKERKNFTNETRLNYKNFTFGIFLKDLVEKDVARGYLYSGIGDYATSVYDFKAYAGYIQSLFKINDKLNLSINSRIELNDYKYEGHTIDNYYYGTPPSIDASKIDTLIGYKMVFSLKQNNNLNYFLSYARGYKAGGVNQHPEIFESNRLFDPEFINNFELGFKFLKDHISIFSTSFIGYRRDQHLSVSTQVDTTDPSSFYFYTANAPKGLIFGAEFDLFYRLTPKFNLSSSLGILNTQVDEFIIEALTGPELADGRESAMAPRLTASLGMKYDFKRFNLSTKTSYKSPYFYSDSHNFKSNSYYITDINFFRNYKNFGINFWVKNLFDVRYETRGFYFGLIPPSFPSELWESYGDPRHYGISLDYNYK